MDIINVIHFGDDYSVIKVGNREFETSLGLGEAIHDALKPRLSW